MNNNTLTYYRYYTIAIMVLPRGSPGAHPDSFETTEPFGFSAATYFVPMSALLGGKLNRY